MVWTPIELSTSSKLAVTLWSRMRDRAPPHRLFEIGGEVAGHQGHWGRRWAAGLGGGAERVDEAALPAQYRRFAS